MFHDIIIQVIGERFLRFGAVAFSAGQIRSGTLSDNKTVHGSVCQKQRRLTLLRSPGTAKVKLEVTSMLQQTG